MSDHELDEAVDDEIIAISVEEIYDAIKNINADLPRVEEGKDNESLINKIFRYVHSIKGLAGMLKLEDIKILSQRVEDVLDRMRNDSGMVTSDRIDLVFTGADICKLGIDAFTSKTDNPEIPVLIEALYKEMEAVETRKAEDRPSPEQASGTAAQEPQDEETARVMEHTVRIKTERLDYLMNRANEIAINSIQLLGSANEIKLISGHVDGIKAGLAGMRNKKSVELQADIDKMEKDFAGAFESLERIIATITESSAQLSDGIIKSRMVSIDELFSLFPRMIRDVAKQFGKKVKLAIESNQIEIDKQLVELIYAPLVHVLRNSVDHGIESPEIRKEQGKTEVGSILLRAEKDDMFLHLTIQDDGGGIDPEKVAAKALEKGLIGQEKLEKMKEGAKIMLICLPGFSTKEVVTDISGRGVGMDVVQSNIEKINGSLSIESELGKGSTFTMMMPHNIAFIQGFLYQDEPGE